MKRWVLLVLILLKLGHYCYSQPNFLVSSSAEIKMNGLKNYFFISHKVFLLYYKDKSNLKVIFNMYDLVDNSNSKIQGQEIHYNTNIEDTNSLIFEGAIDEKEIRPDDKVHDTYNFSIPGTIKYRDNTYQVQLICSYGAKMIINQSKISLNIYFEILKMDNPMYFSVLKEMVDNIKINIEDGTVNSVQN